MKILAGMAFVLLLLAGCNASLIPVVENETLVTKEPIKAEPIIPIGNNAEHSPFLVEYHVIVSQGGNGGSSIFTMNMDVGSDRGVMRYDAFGMPVYISGNISVFCINENDCYSNHDEDFPFYNAFTELMGRDDIHPVRMTMQDKTIKLHSNPSMTLQEIEQISLSLPHDIDCYYFIARNDYDVEICINEDVPLYYYASGSRHVQGSDDKMMDFEEEFIALHILDIPEGYFDIPQVG
jgi:hypothetical protein